jgi:hypothetical protein
MVPICSFTERQQRLGWQPIGLANLRIAAARGSDISVAQESAVIGVAL